MNVRTLNKLYMSFLQEVSGKLFMNRPKRVTEKDNFNLSQYSCFQFSTSL